MGEKNIVNRFSENDALLEITQNFYKSVEVAIADNFPDAKSEYQILKVLIEDTQIPLWQFIEKRLASFIANWPEWFSILEENAEGEIPLKFSYFNEKIVETIEKIQDFLKITIRSSIEFSVRRFEIHPPYAKACAIFKSHLFLEKLEEIPEALPFFDIWSPTRLSKNISIEILNKIEENLRSIEQIRFPYNEEKDCYWNLSLVIRLQIQIIKTLRERIFGIIAMAETYFQEFFTEDLLQEELLPLIRSNLSNYKFISGIYKH